MPAELCLLSDGEMLRRVENLRNLNPIQQSHQVAEMGNYFALIGETGDGAQGLGSRSPVYAVSIS